MILFRLQMQVMRLIQCVSALLEDEFSLLEVVDDADPGNLAHSSLFPYSLPALSETDLFMTRQFPGCFPYVLLK